jgi:hypothetical protein
MFCFFFHVFFFFLIKIKIKRTISCFNRTKLNWDMKMAAPQFQFVPRYPGGLFSEWRQSTGAPKSVELIVSDQVKNLIFKLFYFNNDKYPLLMGGLNFYICVPDCDYRQLDAQTNFVNSSKYCETTEHKFINLDEEENQLDTHNGRKRSEWLRKLTKGVINDSPSEEENNNLFDLAADFTISEKYKPAVATGYLLGFGLLTAFIFKGIPNRRGDITTNSDGCQVYFPPLRALANRFDPTLVATIAAASAAGMQTGWLRSGSARSRNRRMDIAIEKLQSLPENSPKPEIRKLALMASRALVPASVVDEGPGAIVAWVHAQRPSNWKRLRKLGTLALFAAAVGQQSARLPEIARPLAGMAIGLAIGDAALARSDAVESGGAGLLRSRKNEDGVQTKTMVVHAVLGITLERLRLLSGQEIRERVIQRFPRVLEVLFTRTQDGHPYSPEIFIERLNALPQLLRRR